MSNNTQSITLWGESLFEGLFVALRRQHDDARICEMLDALKAKGHTREAIVARVMQEVGADAAVRVNRLSSSRAQQLATGTWKRYQMSRSRRFKLWVREAHDTLEDAFDRLRGAVRKS